MDRCFHALRTSATSAAGALANIGGHGPSVQRHIRGSFQNAVEAGASRAELTEALARALRRGRFDREELRPMAERFGSKGTQARIQSAIVNAREG